MQKKLFFQICSKIVFLFIKVLRQHAEVEKLSKVDAAWRSHETHYRSYRGRVFTSQM